MRTRLILLTIAMLVIASPVARAVDQTAYLLSDDQINLIKANCATVQKTLNGVHISDALARNHLGPEYETISTKFMAPMNSRVAQNKLDSVELTKTTVEFNDKLDQFRSAYQQYDQTLATTLQARCSDQPVAFYDSLTQARAQRSAVQKTVEEMSALINRYRDDVAQVRAEYNQTKTMREVSR